MRARVLTAALLVTAVWAVARSKPAHDAPQAQPTRQIKLVDGGSTALPVVSALEAGRPAELAPARKVTMRAPKPREASGPTIAESNPAELIPEVRPTTSSTVEAMHNMDMAPLPIAPAAGQGILASNGDFAGRAMPAEHGRDPAIIIRGGMGGARDDCDLHRRGGGFGIAINRSSPMLGGVEVGGHGMSYPRGTRIR